ncbi:MAG: O-antigen ligase family protein [Balneolales bacterium]
MKLKYSQAVLLIYSFALVVFSGMEETTMIENFIGAALVGIFFLESSLSNNFIWRWHWSMVFIMLFVAYAFATIILNPESVRRFITVALVMILFYVVYNIISETKSILPVAVGLTLGLFYTFILDYDQIMQSFDGVSNERLSGLVGNPNNYSFYLFGTSLILLLPIIGKYQINPVVRYLIYTCILIFSVLILTTTGSRKGIILLTFILLATFVLMSKGEKAFVKIQYLMIFSILGFFLYNLFSESTFFSRMENIFLYTSGQEVDEGSLETRDNMISTALSMWADKPFIGWGLDSFRIHSGYGTYSHNNYTELLFGQGLIGLSLYYGFFISILFSCSKLLKRFKTTDNYKIIGWAIISIFVLLLWDFAAVSYYDKKYWLMVGITLGILVNTEDHFQKSSSREN